MHSRRQFLKYSAVVAGLIGVPAYALSGCAVNRILEDFRVYEGKERIRGFTEQLISESGARTREEMAMEIVRWAKGSFIHYNLDYSRDSTYNIDKNETGVTIEELLEKRIAGCHLITAFMATMLRSIGFEDADYVRSNFFEGCPEAQKGHGILEIADSDMYHHGDSIVYNQNISPEKTFFTYEQMRQERLISGQICNEDCETRSSVRVYRAASSINNLRGMFIYGMISPEITVDEKEQEQERLVRHLREYGLDFKDVDDGGIEVQSEILFFENILDR